MVWLRLGGQRRLEKNGQSHLKQSTSDRVMRVSYEDSGLVLLFRMMISSPLNLQQQKIIVFGATGET
jgi:hypothetical protein